MDSVEALRGGGRATAPGDDTALGSFILMLAYLGRPADPAQLVHMLGKGSAPLDFDDLLVLAKRLDIKARRLKTSDARLDSLPLPAIAQLADGSDVLLLQISQTHALLFRPGDERPTQVERAAFALQFAGELLLMTTRERMAGAARIFDVSWFIPALVKYRHLLRDVLFASLFIQLLGLASPLFFQVVIDKVLVHKGLTTLEILAAGLFVVSVFEIGLSGLRTYLFAHTTSRVDVELGSKLFGHLVRLPLSYFGARRVGDSVARVRQLDTIREFLTSSALTLIMDLFFTIVFLAVMWLYSGWLLLIVLVTLPLYALVVFLIGPPLRRTLDEKFLRGAENQSFLVESVTGIETLKAMSVEPQMQARWERQIAGYVKTSFNASMLANWGSQAIQLINKLGMLAILFFGARLVVKGDLTVGELVAFNMLAGQVAGPVLRLAQLGQDFQQARIAVARLGDVLNNPVEPQASAGKTSLPQIRGRIVFDNVRFRYAPDSPEVLKGISLDIAPGEVLGIVGPSGSGKSTFAKLVQRLHVPERGRILVDGVDLALVDPSWLRRQVGIVLQENILFNRSVRDNIALADPAMPIENVTMAAELAGAHDFVLEFPHGYDTQIDERGGNLSGGQRQRIAIARALATRPKILIFDEATSALDAESEQIIQRNLKAMTTGRTVIVIAHRLSAVRQADRIITLEKGEITEMGTHEELIRKNGRYASLYRKQMGVEA